METKTIPSLTLPSLPMPTLKLPTLTTPLTLTLKTTTYYQPAIAYFIIAFIIVLIGLLLTVTFDLFIGFVSQFLYVLCITLMLIGLCSIFPQLSWFISALMIICTLSCLIIMRANINKLYYW